MADARSLEDWVLYLNSLQAVKKRWPTKTYEGVMLFIFDHHFKLKVDTTFNSRSLLT